MIKAACLTIIYPHDLWGSRVGGAETFIRSLIRHAPGHIDIEFVGTIANPENAVVGKWRQADYFGRPLRFLPLIHEVTENRRTKIPLSLRFTLALALKRPKLRGKVLLFNRIEPAILFQRHKSFKLLVIHSDIEEQILKKGSEIYWTHFPRLYFTLERYVYGFINKVLTVSSDTLGFYRRRYPACKDAFGLVANGVDTDVFHPGAQSKNRLKAQLAQRYPALDAGAQWIVYAGRLQEAKAPFRLIDSFACYHHGHPASHLLIAGDGNLRSELERHAARRLPDGSVFFLGLLGQDDLAGWYRASDALLLTSNYEGMPMCVLEALACGTPVVSTDVGDVKRVLASGHSGEVSPNTVPENIAACLNMVLSAPQRYTPENCRSRVAPFTAAECMKPIYNLVDRLSS